MLDGHRGSVNALAFNPLNGMLASGSEDGTVLIWDISVEYRRCPSQGRHQSGRNGGHQGLGFWSRGEMGNDAAAPSISSDGLAMLNPSEVKNWLKEARGLGA